MDRDTDTASTPSSLVASLVPQYAEPQLLLAIVFHPDTGRIGETAVLEPGESGADSVIGRGFPRFPALDGRSDAAGLEEPHISRQALCLQSRGADLLVIRPPGASRCRLGGEDLVAERLLSAAEVERGVALLLGHGVLLWLYRGLRPGRKPGCTVPGLLGTGAAMESVREQVRRLAAAGDDLLIRGETGTGKELVARAIHDLGPRPDGPWVAVNMAAVPADLAPALLFGATRGAYTGAERGSSGYFGQARSGTLFLDEIGDAPAQIQPQLLRALQQREIQPVGGAVRTIELRVISATDADLDSAEAAFSAALRHRLGAGEICLPALRDHREDIGVIGWHLLETGLRLHGREPLLPGPESAPQLIAAWTQLFYWLLSYHWPGNVRELDNVLRAVVLDSDELPQLPLTLYRRLREQAVSGVASSPGLVAADISGGIAEEDDRGLRRMADVGEEELARVYRECLFQVATTARCLGVSRGALTRYLDAHPVFRLPGQIPQSELLAAVVAHGGDEELAARSLCISASALQQRVRATGISPVS